MTSLLSYHIASRQHEQITYCHIYLLFSDRRHKRRSDEDDEGPERKRVKYTSKSSFTKKTAYISVPHLDISLKTSTVTCYRDSGISEENFICTRDASVTELLSKVTAGPAAILVTSPPCTGKTTLCTLLRQKLQAMSAHFVFVDFAAYHPKNGPISEHFKSYCGQGYSDVFATNILTYVIIDEWQRIYATSRDEVINCFSSTTPEQVAEDHQGFHNAVKLALNNPRLRFICFASYGTDKIGSLFGSPVIFPVKTSKFAYFAEDEMTELLTDFKDRTQNKWIRESGVPDNLRGFLHDALRYHVGYVARTLSLVNEMCLSLRDERSLQSFLYSKELLENLANLRGTISRIDPPPDNELDALKELVRKGGEDDLSSSSVYLNFIRYGWVMLDQTKISLPCPYSKDILYDRLFHTSRPKADPFENLEQFLLAFLKQLPTELLSKAISLRRDGPILEALWCVSISLSSQTNFLA